MSTSQPLNINDDFHITKPVRKSYIKNGRHKKFQLEKYALIDYEIGRFRLTMKDGECKTYESKTYENFNFKKTSARKYQYSCGGYGGKCPSCKHQWGQEKKYRKIII